jgi:hypothetical protein
MLQYAQRSYKIGGSTNSSFLALILEEANPSSFAQFRPVSLCNSSYKIMTKIIASRMKKIMPKLISENREGFMQDRQIIDNIVLV